MPKVYPWLGHIKEVSPVCGSGCKSLTVALPSSARQLPIRAALYAGDSTLPGNIFSVPDLYALYTYTLRLSTIFRYYFNILKKDLTYAVIYIRQKIGYFSYIL